MTFIIPVEPPRTPHMASPVRDLAYRVIIHSVGGRPPLHRRLRDIDPDAACTALVMLERAFGVDLDVDEAMRTPDLAALIDLVEERMIAKLTEPVPSDAAGGVEGPPTAEIISLDAYRRVLAGIERRLHAQTGKPQ